MPSEAYGGSMDRRRSKIEVIADILRLRQASKTQVMYRVGMSYAQLQKYLNYLVERGFLIHGSSRYPGGIYRVSQEGERLLQSIEKIETILYSDNGTGPVKDIGESSVVAKGDNGKAHRISEPAQPRG